MGNIITNDNGFITESPLGTIINEWAIKDYDAGLGYKKDASSQIKYLLKKRACCVRKNIMSIALPKININNITNPIEDGYETVNISIFADTNEMTQKCSIENKNFIPQIKSLLTKLLSNEEIISLFMTDKAKEEYLIFD